MDIHQLRDDLKRDEGIKFKPYRCTSGKLTIGVGRNLDDVGISEAEAETMLLNDIASVVSDLDMAIPYWKNLSSNRQLALANMCFNLGVSRLLNFRNMLKAIRESDFEKAAEEALDSKWAEQVGGRAYRIEKLIREG